MKKLTLALAFVAMIGSPAFAASATWNGTFDATWAGANWSASPVPGAGDTATFQNAGNGFTTIDLGGGVTVKSITFDNSLSTLAAYTIGSGSVGSQTLTLNQNGSTITLNSNVTNNQLFNSNVVLGISTAGNSSYSLANNSSSLLTIAGAVSGGTTGRATLIASGTGNVTISGAISTGNSSSVVLSKSSTGTLVLSGANSFTGATTVTGGALNLQNNSALGTGVGASTSGVTVSSGAALQLQNNISTTTAVALSLIGTGVTASPNGALENVSGNNTYSGAISIGSGGATIGSDAGTLTLTGGIVNGGNLPTFSGAGNITVSTGVISGTGGLTVASTGTVTFSNANTYNGTTTALKSGTVVIGDANGLGAATTTITLGDNTLTGAVSLLTNGAFTFTRNIAEASAPTNASLSIGGIQTSGTSIYTGDITLHQNTTLTSAAGGEVDFTPAHSISGAFNVTIDGGGTVSLTGTNTFGGVGNSLTVQNGTTLVAATGNANLGNANNSLIFNNGTLKFGAAFDPSTRTMTFNSGGATFDTNGNAVTFANAVGNSGAGGLTLNDSNGSPGSLTLSAAGNNYTGPTTVTSGTLAIGSTGSLTGSSVISVGSAGIFTVANGGSILSTTALTDNGATTFNNATRTIASLNGTNSSASLTLNTTNLTVSGGGSFAGVIKNGGSAGAFTAAGGTMTLSGANTYTGATTVSSGTLKVTGSTASGSAVAVNAGTLNVTGTVGGTVNVASGATLSGTGSVGALTVTGGSIVNLQDGSTNTLSGTSTLTFNTGTGNGVLSIDVGSGSSSDLLALTGAASLGSNLFTVNVNSLSGASTGTSYTFISASGGLTLADFTAGTLTGTLAGDTVSFSGGGTSVLLTINAPSGSTNYYYTGNSSSAFATASNYNTLATGGTAQSTPLSSTSDVFIAATSHNNVAPTLGGTNSSIHSLTFTSDGAGGSVNSTGGQLTVAAGVTDSAGGTSTESVNAPVVLGGDQSFTVTSSGNTLAFNGGISGSHAVTIAGAGKVNFSTDNTYSNGTTVGSGSDSPTLLLTNGHTSLGSATGTGPLTVQAGATIGGDGTSRSSSFAIGGNVMVGNGTDSTSQTTITGATASTFTGANLTFNLNTANTNSNILNVGNTAITFSNTTLTLNLQGGQIIGNDTQYTLIAGSGGATYGPLTTFTNSLGQLQISDGNLTLAFSNGQSEAYYMPSYLFLTGDNIDVEVVPEPSTWAMMLGGLVLLVFWQRRKLV